jgi:hypothetical protein
MDESNKKWIYPMKEMDLGHNGDWNNEANKV